MKGIGIVVMDQKAKVAVKCWLMLIKGFMGNLSNLLEGVATDAGDGHSLDDKVSVCSEDQNSDEELK